MRVKLAAKARRQSLAVLHGWVLGLSFLPCAIYGQTFASTNTAAETVPSFVLVGTSRIGDRHSATLRLSSGKQIIVVSENGGVAPLPGFSGYWVTKIEAGRVVIGRGGSACSEFGAQGTVCDGANTTTLALSVRAFESSAGANSEQSVVRADNDLTGITAEAGSFIESIQTAAAARGEKPEVPNGMQLIETSSGFQLIPDD